MNSGDIYPENELLDNNNSNVNNTSLFNGVVPDLLKVCESLTQSSTPHQFPPEQQQQQQQRFQSNHTYYEHESQEPYPYRYSSSIAADDISAYNFDDHPPPANHYPGIVEPPHRSNNRRKSDLPPSESTTVASAKNAASGRKRKAIEEYLPNKTNNNRKYTPSPRVTWNDDIHREFVGAIFDIGMRHSSPSSILDQMSKVSEEITSERIKSHLQKFRLNKEKSKREYMFSYDAALAKFKARGTSAVPPNLAAGEIAAFLTYSCTVTAKNIIPTEAAQFSRTTTRHPQSVLTTTSNNTNNENPSSIYTSPSSMIIPSLTENEKRSPLGSSLGYIIGLFFTLRQELMDQRRLSKGGQTSSISHPPSLQSEDNQIGGSNTMVSNYYPEGGQHLDHSQQQQQNVLELGGDNALSTTASFSSAGHRKMSSSCSITNPSLEESQKMKLEMREQIAVQHKMRALKQNEIKKYQPGEQQHLDIQQQPLTTPSGVIDPLPYDASDNNNRNARPRTLSEHHQLLNEDFFWSADMVDDQLFEFLMSSESDS